jgi:tight adherence protein B
VTLGVALLVLLLSGGRVVATVVGFAIGFWLPYAWLRFRASRRGNAFRAQMPDTLQLLAGSLSAGYSLPQAVDAVVREGTEPISAEFSRAIIESRLGVPVEDALDNIAERMSDRDFAWVVMAVRIQREVGGNLAEILTTVANTMRERERVRRQARVLSAEGRLSAWILGGLPPVFALYLVLVRPTYIKPLYTKPVGLVMLAIGAMLFSVGVVWLSRVVRVEV